MADKRLVSALRQIKPSSEEISKIEDFVSKFSIVMGGPIYDSLERIGLVRYDLPNVVRRIVALVTITWLPLFLFSLKDGVAFGDRVKLPLLYDFSMYGRFLLSLPLLLLAEIVIDPAIRLGVAQFVRCRIVQDQQLQDFENVLRKVQRLRDSLVPEIIMLLVAFFPLFLFQREWTGVTISNWHGTAHRLTAAGWWFAAFSSPMLRFIIYRWCFRYFLWMALLWRITRLRLVLLPTHPDHAAGLGFLELVQRHFGILFGALGCTLVGHLANDIVFKGAALRDSKSLMIGFVVLSLIIGLFPLMLLAPKLRILRTAGILEYGKLGHAYVESFDKKWVHFIERPSESLLGTSDIQSLADMGNSFGMVEAMRIVPISKRLILQLAAQTSAPLIPLIIFGTPTPELVRGVMKLVA